MAITGPSHIGICVSDLDRSIHFYCAVLGFTMIGRQRVQDADVARLLELGNVDMELAMVEFAGLRLELIAFATPRGEPRDRRNFNQLGFTHLSLRVENFDATLRDLEQAGVQILHHTAGRHRDSNARFAFCVDPDGTRIELFGAIEETGPKAWDTFGQQ